MGEGPIYPIYKNGWPEYIFSTSWPFLATEYACQVCVGTFLPGTHLNNT